MLCCDACADLACCAVDWWLQGKLFVSDLDNMSLETKEQTGPEALKAERDALLDSIPGTFYYITIEFLIVCRAEGCVSSVCWGVAS